MNPGGVTERAANNGDILAVCTCGAVRRVYTRLSVVVFARDTEWLASAETLVFTYGKLNRRRLSTKQDTVVKRTRVSSFAKLFGGIDV